MTAIDTGAVRAALLSPDLDICSGLGSARVPGSGSACTIAEINLVLTGRLSDEPHPCISEVIRRWVIRIQDVIPAEMRNSAAWREAAVGIAGSVGDSQAEIARRDLILNWMWDALGDQAVLDTIPAAVRPVWDQMLAERTADAAHAAHVAAHAAYVAADAAYAAHDAYAAADAAYAAHDAAYAADAAAAAADAAYAAADAAYVAHAATDAYWVRRNPAGLLVQLIEAGQS